MGSPLSAEMTHLQAVLLTTDEYTNSNQQTDQSQSVHSVKFNVQPTYLIIIMLAIYVGAKLSYGLFLLLGKEVVDS